MMYDDCDCDCSEWEGVDPNITRAEFVESLDARLRTWYDFHIAASWNEKTEQEKLIWRQAFDAAAQLIKSEELDQYDN